MCQRRGGEFEGMSKVGNWGEGGGGGGDNIDEIRWKI